MKFGRRWTGRIGAALAGGALMLTTWTSPVRADSAWGEIHTRLTAGNSCLALDGRSGSFYGDNTKVTQWGCNGHLDQQWSLHLYGYESSVALWQVINLQSRKC